MIGQGKGRLARDAFCTLFQQGYLAFKKQNLCPKYEGRNPAVFVNAALKCFTTSLPSHHHAAFTNTVAFMTETAGSPVAGLIYMSLSALLPSLLRP